MAKTPPNNITGQKGGFLSLFGGVSKKRWEAMNMAGSESITQSDMFRYGAHSATIATLLSGAGDVRSRSQIYLDWLNMSQDAICSSAIKLATTTAMGGHATSGDIVFIEKKPDIQDNKKLCALVEEVSRDLSPLLNRHIYALAYTGATFGDAYARIYAEDKRGVIHINTDEMLHPSLVQPFERGGKTVGFAVSVGERNFERLGIDQVVRLKMPRTQWVPQNGVIEKSLRTVLTENNVDRLAMMPAMAGGSLLHPAEKSYKNLNNTLLGLIAQRLSMSLDHKIVGLQMEGMTERQQDLFGKTVIDMYKKVKDTVADSVKTGRPIVESIVSILPMFSEKQLITLSQGNTATQTITIDDVLFHARMMAAALGTDLSNLGFSDQVSGWMGDGGLSRTLAQSAENSRVIRMAARDFVHDVIDIHTLRRHGFVFNEAERPWQVNFYGSIAALEAEKQKSEADKMAAGLTIVQAMQMFKDMGATAEMMESLLSKNMSLEESQAKLFSEIVNAAPPDSQDMEA